MAAVVRALDPARVPERAGALTRRLHRDARRRRRHDARGLRRGRAGRSRRACPSRTGPTRAFPTVAFPNPEEPGATDLLMALAERIGADVAIAEDPDADRCAVVCDGRQLTGDEVGALLADWLLRRGVRGTYASSLVSGSLLHALTAAHGVPFGRDAHRLQVDHAGRLGRGAAGVRLRGGARLLGDARRWRATRTASPRPSPSRCWPRS